MAKTYYRAQGEVLAPEREPLDELIKMRTQLGSDIFSAQYQQAPVPPGGAMIKREWVRRYKEIPAGAFIVESWDTASKGGPDNDWSVCTTWLFRDLQFYLLDLWRGRVNYPGLKGKVVQLAEKWRARQVLAEEAGTAVGLLAELKSLVRGLKGSSRNTTNKRGCPSRQQSLRPATYIFRTRALAVQSLRPNCLPSQEAAMMTRSMQLARPSIRCAIPDTMATSCGESWDR
jgi:phage terminase large subunit-like protein